MNSTISDSTRILELEHLGIDPSQYSTTALERFKEKMHQYALDLAHESGRIARTRQSDIISAHYVDEAAGRLLRNTDARLARLIGTFGGLLLGVAGSGILGLISKDKYSGVEVAVYFSLGVLGAMATVYQVRKE